MSIIINGVNISEIKVGGSGVTEAWFQGVRVYPDKFFYTLTFSACSYSSGDRLYANASNYAYNFKCQLKKYVDPTSALVETTIVYPTPVATNNYVTVTNGNVSFNRTTYGKTVISSATTFSVNLSLSGASTTGTIRFGGNNSAITRTLTDMTITPNYFYASGGTGTLSGGHLLITSSWTSGDYVSADTGTGAVEYENQRGDVNYPEVNVPSWLDAVHGASSYTITAIAQGVSKTVSFTQQGNAITSSGATVTTYVNGAETDNISAPYNGQTYAITATSLRWKKYTSNYSATTSVTQDYLTLTIPAEYDWITKNGWNVTIAQNTGSSTRDGHITVTDTAYGASKRIDVEQALDIITATTTATTAVTLSIYNPATIPAAGGSVDSCSYSVTAYNTTYYYYQSGRVDTGATTSQTVTNYASMYWTGVTAESRLDDTGSTYVCGTLSGECRYNGVWSNTASVSVSQQYNYVTDVSTGANTWNTFVSSSVTTTGSENKDWSCSVSPSSKSFNYQSGSFNVTTTAGHKTDYTVQTAVTKDFYTQPYSSITYTSTYVGTKYGTTTSSRQTETDEAIVTSAFTDTVSVKSKPSWVTATTSSISYANNNKGGQRVDSVVYQNANHTATTASISLTQGADSITATTYECTNVSITLNTPATIPASGGSVNSTTIYSIIATTRPVYHYQSGEVDYGSTGSTNVTNQYKNSASWNGVSAESKMDVTGGTTSAGTLTASVTCSGKTGTGSATVYQDGNYVVNSSTGSNSSTQYSSTTQTITDLGVSGKYCTVSPSSSSVTYGGGTVHYSVSAGHYKDFSIETVVRYKVTTTPYTTTTYTSKYVGTVYGTPQTGSTTDTDVDTITSAYTDTASVDTKSSWITAATTTYAGYQGNNLAESRTGTIKFKNNAYTSTTATYSLTQAGNPNVPKNISVSPTSHEYNIYNTARTISVTVTADYAWTASTDDTILTLSQSSGNAGTTNMTVTIKKVVAGDEAVVDFGTTSGVRDAYATFTVNFNV